MDVTNQQKITGTIILDPYGLKITDEEIEYQQQILDFISRDLSLLGSTSSTTVDIDDPYKDPTILNLIDDSFYWGWYQETASPQMFSDSRTKRVFLYNADDNGASDITDAPDEEGPWLNLSLLASNPGYASSAGAVDSPGVDGYLFPRPFFDALHKGASLGEAFLFSTQYINWKMILVGDPLITVNFPLAYSALTPCLSIKETCYQTIRAIESYLKKMARLNRIINESLQYFLDNPDFDLQNIFYSNINWKDTMADISVSEKNVDLLVKAFVDYFELSISGTLSESLDEWGIKVSSRFQNAIARNTSKTIDNSLVYEDGWWETTFVYNHSALTYENINFVIEVARDSLFIDIIYTISTEDSVEGWLYEKEICEFFPMPETGFPSNYSSRRVRFISPEEYYLTSTEKYFYRVYTI